MFFEESLGKINAEDVELFWNESVYEFYRLKALITLEQMNNGEANWSAVVNFHCMQMSLVMSRPFFFGDERKTRHVHHVFALQQ